MTNEAKGPTLDLELRWQSGLVFDGRVGERAIVLDGDGRAGVSPVQALAFGLASCMASDVVYVLQKGRLPLEGLRAVMHAERAATHPRRIVRIELRFEVSGAVPADKVQRAIDLSRQTYCSVWHSLRPDIEFVVTHL